MMSQLRTMRMHSEGIRLEFLFTNLQLANQDLYACTVLGVLVQGAATERP